MKFCTLTILVEVYAKSYCSCTLQLNLFLSLPTFLTHSSQIHSEGTCDFASCANQLRQASVESQRMLSETVRQEHSQSQATRRCVVFTPIATSIEQMLHTFLHSNVISLTVLLLYHYDFIQMFSHLNECIFSHIPFAVRIP